MPRFSRFFAVLLLVFLPLMSWGGLARLWNLLTSAQADNGCELDPNGRCRLGTSTTATTDNGCELDPSGRCRN